MPDTLPTVGPPAAIARALAGVRPTGLRAELSVSEIPAPASLAPWSAALAADVVPARHSTDSELGTGRFILLCDPEEPEAWGGPFRVICYAQAPLEPEMGVDPFLAEVAWSWLLDALAARDAGYSHASGTATKVLSTGFGELGGQHGAQLELRASWSPSSPDIGAHVESWGDLLCMLAGLPPAMEGVSVIRPRRGGTR